MWWYMEGNKEQGWRWVGTHSKHCSHTCVIWMCNLSFDPIVFNRLNTLIGYAKSGCVHNMAYIKDPITCWYGNLFYSSFSFAFLCNFTLGSNGTPMGLHSSNSKRFNISLRYLIWLMRRSRSSRFLSTSIPKRNAIPQGPSFQTFDLVPLWFAKVCFDHCTPKWGHPHRPQWKTSHLPLVQHTH